MFQESIKMTPSKWFNTIWVFFFIFIANPCGAFDFEVLTLKLSQRYEKRVNKIALKNGMTFILFYRKESPTVTLHIRNRVGSVYDKPDQIGTAHMLEHMMAKGTHRIGIQNYQKAQTSKDSTQYIITLAPQSLELWAKIESDRMQNLVFRGFYKERDVILEERLKTYRNSPMNLLKEKLLKKAFPDSPYGQSNIGTAKEIQSLSPSILRAFYKDYYRPKNFIITIVGNFNPQRMSEIIDQYFASIPSGKQTEPVKMTSHRPMNKKNVSIEGKENIIMVGFYAPPATDLSAYPLRVIKAILIRSVQSRLYRSLVANDLAHSVRVYSLPGVKSTHLFTIIVKAKRNYFIKSIEKIVFSEILMLKKIKKRELLRAKYYIYDDFIRDLSSDIALAGDLSYFEDVYSDWKDFFNFPDRIKQVKLKDIQRVVDQYMVSGNSIAGIMRSTH